MEGHVGAPGTRASQPKTKRKLFDWISEPNTESITPFQRFILDVDWRNSPLGPIQQWPAQLRQMVLLVVQDPSPAVIYWGDDATIVYNEPYTHLIGQKHPALQGQDPKIEFAEIWDHFENLLAEQRETGQTTVEANAFLLLFRHGFLEETYFSWKFVPIIGSEGWVVGSHATVVEVTREVIGDRRLQTVHELSRELSGSKNVKDLWVRLLDGISGADKDIPVAFLYSVADSTASSTEPGSAPSSFCILEGCVGVPIGHELVPAVVNLEDPECYLAPALLKARHEMGPVVAPISEAMRAKFPGIAWRGFGLAPSQIGIYPIIPTDSDSLLAFLVIGLNPRRPYDEGYSNFLLSLTQQVTTPQLSAVILREEIERRQYLARQEAVHRDRLSRELSESEKRFAKFVERAPIGIAILSPDGLAISANPRWREMTQLEVGSQRVLWDDVLVEGEIDHVNQIWERLLQTKKPSVVQARMKRRWRAPDLDAEHRAQWSDTYIQFEIFPDFDENGNITTIMSVVTDISAIKWTENQLRGRMLEAIELKRQTERHIDMTSHEMRNPLSALIGCADEILASLNELRTSLKKPKAVNLLTDTSELPTGKTLHLVDEAIEAADTIIYCAMHQKRIIDDILTLSRLDSNLLLVSPQPSQPLELVRGALKMFEAELKRAGTTLDFVEEESLEIHRAQWTLLDPSRVLQVLINLMTNAIKFTRTESKRHIKITMGASTHRPSISNHFNVQYVRKSNKSPDQTNKPEWGDGEVLYLCITVQDTGRGLDENETKNLFHLFAQASPKTYQTYGGSGLGLFICRQLVEMQGGEIGVASERAKGSTFQFYVKTRRTTAVETLQKDLPPLVREDALREACAVGTPGSPALLSGVRSFQMDSAPASPANLAVDKTLAAFHILVVEDNLVNQKVVTKQLRKAGHVVHVANHGEEALAFIRASEFWSEQSGRDAEKLSVVLMDLEMPVMDGITAVKRIRELQKGGAIQGHVPIIAVTANARQDQITRSLDAGMDGVITKPYRIQAMLKEIKQICRKHTRASAPQESLPSVSSLS